ncbi:hypothetical protein JWG45_01515 [Leptospira sp. 201903070]|jgi:hypothetical protein|uniref:Ig-like domain-containing protein n=1 Tax=Leptospira ainlahdjerensis TaxID=2810033 RepID=A0ABS2U625_9LEPT|nr:hypothetical protein [Leptospira ainlahdjerensis]MBM9575821.1 hypothetical protein [Leptospira ainlahdjerensis]
MKELNKVSRSNSSGEKSFSPFGILKYSKTIMLSLLILAIAVSCKPKQTEEEKSDELFLNLIMASVLLNPCNSGVRFSSNSTAITVPAGQSLTICGDQNATPTLTFTQAGSYKLTATSGTQTHSSSKCNSIYSDFEITVKDPSNTLILTSAKTAATLDITAAANSVYTLTVNGVSSSSPYTCQGLRASVSTSPALLTITRL